MLRAKQRRALFWTSNRSSNRPKVVRTVVCFDTFYFLNVLRATTACTFSHRKRSKSHPKRECVLYTFYFQMCFAPQRRALFRHVATSQKWSEHEECFVHFYFKLCFAPQRRARFPHLNVQKSSEHGVFCYILTSKCASRHNGVHFFHISTSKSAPSLTCFATFYFQMCFAPQRRAQFSTSQLPKVV